MAKHFESRNLILCEPFFSDVPSQLILQVSQLPRLITNLTRRNLDSFVSTTAKVGNCDGK